MAVTIGVSAVVILLIGVFWVAARSFLKYRGTRVVTCPETSAPAAVEVAALRTALTAALGKQTLELRDCSRWPERQGCGQDCLAQIEQAPESSLVRTIFKKWYADKKCVLCGKKFGELEWLQPNPALMSADRVTSEWNDIPAAKIPEALATHMPVCWNCHIAETFRREHPDLVLDRGRHRARSGD